MHICLFDIDGTLISSGGAGKAALEAGFTAAFQIPCEIERLQLSGRTDRAIGRDLLRSNGFEASPENWRRLLTSYLQHLPLCLARTRGRALPGIVHLLERLAEREDIAVGLLTGNVRAGAKIKLGHYDLHHHFDFGGFGDHHHDRDDVAREAFAEVKQRFNGTVTPDRVWVIGDTPLDVRCARAIGARAVAVATGWHSVAELTSAQPDLVLSDLSDAEPLLRQWQ